MKRSLQTLLFIIALTYAGATRAQYAEGNRLSDRSITDTVHRIDAVVTTAQRRAAETVPAQVLAGQELKRLNVVSVAGHDTASAVAAVPALDENFAYLSSGTWSLMGIESKEPVITPETYELNYTNEGGVEGTTRFLKNICGMWILEQCRKEWTLSGKDYSYPEIVEMAMSATPFKSFIQPDDPSFANPPSMLEAIDAFCERTGQEKPENDAQVIRLIFESLALRYRQVLEDLDRIATHPIERLHIIGGGSKNRLLNQLTANAIGRKVVAGPSEATAIGNVMIQAMAAGVVSSLQEMRSIIHASVETEEFAPELVAEWEEAYQKFVTLK